MKDGVEDNMAGNPDLKAYFGNEKVPHSPASIVESQTSSTIKKRPRTPIETVIFSTIVALPPTVGMILSWLPFTQISLHGAPHDLILNAWLSVFELSGVLALLAMIMMHRNLPKVKQDHAISQKRQRASRKVKKQKIYHPDFPPPRYFDNLPEKYFTKFMLRESDRRNDEARRSSDRPQEPTRPCTRLAVAQWKDSHPSAEDWIEACSSKTLEQIRRYAKHGGPDLGDLRGTSNTAIDYLFRLRSSFGCRKRLSDYLHSRHTRPMMHTKGASPYDPNFRQHIADHGIFTVGYKYLDDRPLPKPENLTAILEALEKPRPSLNELSFEEYHELVDTITNISNERNVMNSVLTLLEGEARDNKFTAGGVQFRNLNHLTDGSLVAGSPDQYHGARPEQLHRTIRQNLDNSIIPSTHKNLPIAPNFFLEAKGPGGTLAVAILQACYNGALGARGIHNLRSYGSCAPTTYDNRAYTITATYVAETLTIYATHPIRVGERTELIMTRLCAFALTGGLRTFREAATAYRNAIDWAAQQRDIVIRQANERFAQRAAGDNSGSRSIDDSQHEDMIKSLDPLAPVSPHESNKDSKDGQSLDTKLPLTNRRSTRAMSNRNRRGSGISSL
ncbi:hypothetical protein B0J13DRAFT_674301 [Dactylonectria estremocensis]|uniref:DUF7924 domain-containing protein n=1 Tax=Dactylonectria estremocensis TaxID=1079267 RepID=A0A9P9J5L9_9HYPO|nr:hypothetical protein B0J13DRAFT_674301 [Dactylonectria estremocensis]